MKTREADKHGDSGGKVSILGVHCEKKKVHMNICLILNGYWDTAVWIYRYKSTVIGNRER
jgi:hypothetical protein